MKPGSFPFLYPALILAAASCISASPTPPPSRAASGQADARSAEIAARLAEAMGGQRTWDQLPYLRFDFVVVREGTEAVRFRHWWDKKNGRCRVEGPDDQGRNVTAIFALKDKQGRSFTDGIVDTDPKNVQSIIQLGYERWVNDVYWLAMPFKLRDPGTRLRHARTERTEDGESYDVLELSFDQGVGLTPADRYWLYVNQRTHLIDRWDYVLQSQKPPPQSWSWQSWTSIGPVKLSLVRRMEGRPVMIRFDNVTAPESMDETVFTYSRVRG